MKTSDVSELLAEFFEVATHCILYTRNVYPTAAFERKRKYNTPVQICYHPDVKSYIDKVTENIQKLLHNNEVKKVVVTLLDDSRNKVEQFIFDVELEPHANNVCDYLDEVQRAFQAFCLKINLSLGDLQISSQATSFSVQIHIPEESAEKMMHRKFADDKSLHWVEADREEQLAELQRIVTLKSVHTPLFSMQLYAMEDQN